MIFQKKGDKFPFPYGAAISLEGYNQVREKVALADSVILAKNTQITNLRLQVSQSDSALSAEIMKGQRLHAAEERHRMFLANLSNRYSRLLKTWEPKKPFYRRPSFWVAFGTGLAVGTIPRIK